MYTNVNGGYFGTPLPYSWPDAGTANEDTTTRASDWFFQMVFCATTASIVSGTLAERIKLWPFLIFTAILTGFSTRSPVPGSGAAAGSAKQASPTSPARRWFTRSAAGLLWPVPSSWARARASTVQTARSHPMPGSNMALATLGTFILWLGWFGFNGASQLAMGTNGDVSDISRIFANTNIAAAGGVVAAMILTQILYKKVDVTMALNGALAGLVSITAEPLMPAVWQAIMIGAVGGAIVVFAVPMLDKLKIDDVVGAIPVHLLAGIWGTFIVPLSNPDMSYGTQILGIVSYRRVHLRGRRASSGSSSRRPSASVPRKKR
jgi:Amt family ammonium transporter